MRYLIILVGFAFLCGCSKSSQPESSLTAANQVVPKTLSGIFVNSMQDSQDDYYHYDFRTDGSFIFTALVTDTIADGKVVRTTVLAGKGNYAVQGDRVSVIYPLLIKTSYLPDYGVVSKDIWQTNEELFRIDGDDLIHLATIPGGGLTNIDTTETRFIRKR